MTYTELQTKLRSYREAGYTSIPLNRSYMELLREYCEILDYVTEYRNILD